MGSNDIPPPHVSPSYHTICTILLGSGGLLWTTTYVLMIRQSLRDRTYSMPILPLAMNFAWEIIFSLYVSETVQEKTVFATWMILDIGLVYTMIEYGENEWRHAPIVGWNIGKIFFAGTLWWCWALWAFCSWWLDPDSPVNPKHGKIHVGIIGLDTTELGYWTALVAQVVLSVSLLAQILVRSHSRGTSYVIWASRFFGSLFGLVVYYHYCYYAWPEAHGYVRSTSINTGWKMASSDDDEDLKRAIVMSLEDSQPAGTTPSSSANTGTDSANEDEDLRRAIALSLQESEITNRKESDQPSTVDCASSQGRYAFPLPHLNDYQSHNSLGSIPVTSASIKPSSGLLGLDRKAMEAERLARLGKRKRSPSPKRPSKMAIKPERENELSRDNTNIHSLIQYSRGSIKRTWAFQHPRTDDIKIEELLQPSTLNIAVLSAFDFDVDWMFSKLNPLDVKQIWIMNAKGEDTQKKLRAEAKEQGIPPTLKIHFPPMDKPIQRMHSKLMLLFHSSHLRIAVPTANLTKFDWGETNKDPRTGESWQGAVFENSVFIIDLPRRKDEKVGNREELSLFGKDLLRYLEAQKLSKNVVEGVLKFDFSETHHVAFIHSIGGEQVSSARTGLLCLSSALRELNLDHVQILELDYAASSLGSLKVPFLKRLYAAASGESGSKSLTKVPHNFLDRMRIYFPTRDTVVKSTGGEDCGGVIILNRSSYAASGFPKQCMRDYRSTRPGVLSHNKILLARGVKEDQMPFAWVYIGSANLSESAWGKQKTAQSASHANWECGVLVPVAEEVLKKLDLAEGEVPPMSVFKGTLEVPFQHPGEMYRGKQPWFFN
ncbi:phospholipase D/nuclease [Lojkania enalia]|uniref:Phospholipase D/nuclease n=1 Tax=Lojkania enalia TaxID=147567 RepID=A0A9P4NB02_9PLEO|nr:phospholipase D/nuclease [Didymosphaeria enalia]